MGIEVIQIPAQTAKDILAGLKKHIELASTLLMNPVDITLHIPLRITRAQDGNFSLQQLGQCFLPLV